MEYMTKKQRDYYEILSKWQNSGKLPINWWPKYVYHYTNITNLIEILKDEKIYSRKIVEQFHLMNNDNANREVIDITSENVKECVRLYFRPLTPTQYWNEGFKSREQRQNNANVPVPVFLTFRSYKILALDGCKFSEKGLYTNQQLHDSPSDLEKFNYEKIFSDGRMREPQETKSYRHAEVIFKDSLELSYLDNIWCRTSAEYTTLVYLLKKNMLYDKYSKYIGIKDTSELFYKNGSFINKVDIYADRIIINYHISQFNHKNSKFKMSVELTIDENTQVRDLEITIDFEKTIQFTIQPETRVHIRNASVCILTIKFDNELMYCSDFSITEDIPF